MEENEALNRNDTMQAACEIARAFIYGDGVQEKGMAWCDRCKSRVPMVTVAVAAILEKTNLDAIFERVGRGFLHFRTSSLGALSICLCSLIGPAEESRKPIDQSGPLDTAKLIRRGPNQEER